jgi:hypothetical protein
MSPECAVIRGKLHFYERDHLQLTKCLCRGIELQLSARPEEVVRQILLYFLIYESGLFPGVIEVKAEYNNLDIAVFGLVSHDNFRPLQLPLVIVEVKREDEFRLLHESQLLGYMRDYRSHTGVLFNGSDILLYDKYSGEKLKPCPLASLADLGDKIRGLADRLCSQNEEDVTMFKQAESGDSDSFVQLVQRYGKYTNHTIAFRLKDHTDTIIGCCFKVQGRVVLYVPYGMYRQKPLSFQLGNFDRLVSLTY